MRTIAAILALTGSVLLGPIVAAPPASAINSNQQSVLDAINHQRHLAGRPKVTFSSKLSVYSTSHSNKMANSATLFHDQDLGADLTALGCVLYGENLGAGPSISDIVNIGWLSDKIHKHNMLNSRFTRVGIGVVKDAGGTYWVTADFCS